MHEAYRGGRLEIRGLIFVIMEPPDARYPFANSRQLTIDGCDRRENLNAELMKGLANTRFFRSFYVRECSAFMHVAGTDAEFTWVNELARSQ